jgi:hypothetical protein
MSIEPDRYPIEPEIVAMVFSFNCLRVCPPYWSCEGHLFPNGKIFRVPQVWFHSRTSIVPKLIGDFLSTLRVRHAIRNPWHVCLTFAEGRFATGYSLEPDCKEIDSPDLPALQRDARIIAENLVVGVKALASEYLDARESGK